MAKISEDLSREILERAKRLHRDVQPFVSSAYNVSANLSDAHRNIGNAINRGDADGIIAHHSWYLQAIRETKLYHQCYAVRDAADCLQRCIESIQD